MVVLSKTNRERGYLQAVDAYIFVVPRSKIVQDFVIYMPNRYRNGQSFELVVLSETNRERGYLRPEDA